MKKEFLHVFSFVMIAIFTFSCIGAVSAEETFDIPVIEEVLEEELAEIFPEYDDVELQEVTKEEASFALYDVNDTLVAYYADTVDGDGNITSLAIDQAVSAAQDGYTLKLLEDYEYDKTYYGKSGNNGRGDINFGVKSFTVDGSDGKGGRYMITDKYNRVTYASENGVEDGHDYISGFSCPGNMTFKNIIINSTATNSAQSHTYGFIGISGNTLTLENVELRNLYGVNGGAVWITGGGKLVGTNVTVTGGGASNGSIAVYSGSASISGLTATNVNGTVFGVGAHGNTTTGYVENANVTGCNKAFSAGSNAEITFGEDVSATGNTVGMSVEKGGLAKISNNLNITGNTSNVVLASDDLLEIDSTFTGSIGVSMSDGLKFGHLAEGTESFAGTIFKGTDPATSYTTFGELLGDGKITAGETEYFLMNSFEGEYNADDMVIPYKYYLKTGNETDGYVRTPYDSFLSAYDGIESTGTVYVLTDIISSTDINASHQDLSGNKEVVFNGLGHKISLSGCTEGFLFALYNKIGVTFENFIVDGGDKELAYIANNGGGGEVSAVNCVFYNGYRNGAAGVFHSVVSTEGNESLISIKDTRFINCDGSNGALYVATVGTIDIDNAEFIGCNTTTATSNGIIYLLNKAKLNLGKVSFEGSGSADIYVPVENAITIGADFAEDVTVNCGDNVWFASFAEGVTELKGSFTHKTYGYKADFHKNFIKTATASTTIDGKTYSFKDKTNFAKDVIPDNAVVMGWPMYRRTGTSETGYTRVGYSTLNENSLCTSAWDGAVLYLLDDVAFGTEFVLNTGSPPHFNAGGGKVSTVNGNGHKISRTDGGAYSVVLFGNSDLTFENVIYDGNEKSALGYTNKLNGGGTFRFKNCVLTNGGADGVVYAQLPSAQASHNFYFDNTIVASGYRAVKVDVYSNIYVNDSDILDCTTSGLGGAISLSNNSGLADSHNTLTFTGTNTIINCHSTGNAAGAVYLNKGVMNVSGTLTITDCSANSGGGAMYAQSGTTINLQGKINISGNKSGANENNIYLAAYDIIKVAGNIEEGSAIGISMAQTGKAFATAANADITGIEAFYADNAVIPVYGTYFPNTVGDGKFADGTAAPIDMTEVNARVAGRELDIVLHWPWLVKKSDGVLAGYVSLATAAANANDSASVIYAQKDINVDYRGGEGGIVDGGDADADAISEYINKTEFPLWTAFGSYNHIDMQSYIHLDGNGHVIDALRTSSGEIFVLYSGNKFLTLDNIIYTGAANQAFATVHKSAALGTEVITVNNSYLGNGTSKGVLTVYKGGTLNITDSTVDSYIYLSGTADLTTKVNIYGDVNIKGGNGLDISNEYVNVTVDGSYCGEIEAAGNASQIKVGEGFTSLESVSSITKAGSNGETFAYYDEANKKFAWTMAPELTLKTDSGKYSDGLGTIRFLTTFKSVAPDAVASYGTYAVGASSFDENAEWQSNQFKEFDKTPGADKVYYVDAVKIPAEHFDTEIAALSFVKIKGIKTPIYYDFNLASVNKNDTETGDGVLKNLGDPTYTEA